MSKIFHLPDLGEGLAEADIVKWYVIEGQHVTEDDPLVSVETAKALVDVPAPVTGIVKKIHAQAGTTVPTHCVLAEFDMHEPQIQAKKIPTPQNKPEAQPTHEVTQPKHDEENRPDSGTVVGKMATATQVSDDFFIIGKNREKQSEKSPLSSPAKRHGASFTHDSPVLHSNNSSSTTLPIARGAALNTTDLYDTETIRGSRRTMADAMQLSHENVAQVTLFDQADISSWFGSKDITSKVVHAICEAAKEVPRLNAWLDMEKRELHIHHHVNLGLAVDTEDGLFVPVLQQINRIPQYKIRQVIDDVVQEVKSRTASPDRFKRATISLSNFGAIAGRYATPMVVPPAVAILGVGRYFQSPKIIESKKGKSKIGNCQILPLSLSFDHRAATGGEGARFLRSIIRELEA